MMKNDNRIGVFQIPLLRRDGRVLAEAMREHSTSAAIQRLVREKLEQIKTESEKE